MRTPKPKPAHNRRRDASGHGARPRGPAAAPQRPLYLFLTEPGLSGLALLELRHLKLVTRKARPLRLGLRNYDVLVLPGDVVAPGAGVSRLCTNVLRASVFGRSAVTPRQLDALATLFRQGGYARLTASLAGDHFNRLDLARWVRQQLISRGVALAEAGRALWLIVVDDKFYFGEELQNYHDAPGRDQASTRSGALPPTIGAAMVFAAQVSADDVVWEPTAGSGGLVGELLSQSKAPVLATDVDANAVAGLRQRFARAERLWTAHGDAGVAVLPRSDLSLTIANLPFGALYQPQGGAAALYLAILRNSLAHAGRRWRGVFLTSDGAAMSDASARAGLAASVVAEIKVRGMSAAIWKTERPG
ncbi:MAG TPA: hypothetical protein VGF50_00350 [Caulobacteraceae bacterium]